MKQLNNKIAKQIIQVSGIDLFQNSRRREVVEVRSIFIKILKEHQNMTFYGIRDYFCDHGKCINHAIEYLNEDNINNVSEYVDNLVTEQITI